MSLSWGALVISTISIALLHTLAPDHWVPFVMIGKAQDWSVKKLLGVTFIGGAAHVISSVVLGAIGIVLGLSVSRLKSVESSRAEVAGLLIIGFGIAYTIYGLKHIKHGHMHHLAEKRNITTIWVLVAIFLLGPCEPLIPLMFLGINFGWYAVFLVSLLFSISTVGMMLVETWLAFSGVRILKAEKWSKYTHSLAGLTIAATGAIVMLLGI
jgi:nickel/cobalt exporter